MGYVWLSAGMSKLNHQLSVSQNIQGYQIFTPEWSDFLAHLIGPLEVAGGVLLILGIFLRGSSKVAFAVLVLFMVGISQAWIRGLDIDCGCFGSEPSDVPGMDYAWTLARDTFFLFLTGWTIWRPFRKFAVYV